MGRYPEEKVWELARFVDVDVDLRAFHTQKSAALNYFALEEGSACVLGRLRELRLVSLRVVVVRVEQWRTRRNGHWRPWENSGMMLREWLKGRVKGREVKLAMQYIWNEGIGTNGVMPGHLGSEVGHKAFIDRYPGGLSKDVQERWQEMGVFLQDGSNQTQTVYDTEREIFCRNFES
jgi:hypothetical protein